MSGSSTSVSVASTHPRAAFAFREFRLYQTARLIAVLATEMQSVAVGWQVYSITHQPLDLGLVGLAQFLPMIGFSLFTGHVADRFDRRIILLICHLVLSLCSALLLLNVFAGTQALWPIYAVLALIGTARAFSGPAGQALMPHLVPPAYFGNAVAWSSSIFHISTILGPALGGGIYGLFHFPSAVYAGSVILGVVTFLLLLRMQARTGRMEKKGTSWDTLLAGVRYVWKQPVILGAISLDLFAVLLGGAVALLPIYAKDILHAGPEGLGLLRSAPALGASIVAIVLAYHPLKRNTGATMLACVGLFGLATIVFGISRSFWISLAALVIVGASDMISVYVRMTLVQMATPPEMRGRVSAVNLIFVGASNELGEFESGLTAQWLGAVRAVVLGGIGTCLVVALWAWRFPALRNVDRLEDVVPSDTSD